MANFLARSMATKIVSAGTCSFSSTSNILASTNVSTKISATSQTGRPWAKITKTKLRRLEKKKARQRRVDAGLPAKKLPQNYIPKNMPIINASPHKESDTASLESMAAEDMRTKIESQGETLRFHFSSLMDEMSPKVKKLFDLTNGSQKEIVKAQKAKGMELFQVRDGDTGSSAVQVIALTTRIQQLQTHINFHKKDKSSKRGLDALYVRRRKLLDYMERKEFDSYRKIVRTLGLVR
mmetsp:Transcript_19748/g.27765  ORF Transcript_19748/g.27765 Transcript_19748/m.27765 type:complete len:237 (+) Transcript_19748:68-778(+)|eukprot:CAMPEP_0184865900 /NCGR_PEP_ID=MMETSP0580-20130426/19603_1 /TAXON_ID=1118495 /ORGANISM="Dactyliosolen fragilissimus" /LENGTH=236 /DNA_ID=CAMNT_0027365281 /DNA_START=55 /DNA_END=765 /DNA_ORIENTATION=-